ncbi:MAG: ABC transporter ATP-binding protein [Rhodospirillaceae bacterium]|nr:ABC transporter ATP-binding protein [Rhodospirillaceae bacterium]
MLEISNATVHYRKVAALRGVSMSVPDGAVVTIIGANGAGKSTLLRAISGLVALSAGEIRFAGRRIDGIPPERGVALGIAQVPEGRRVFPDLTVQENLGTGAYLRRDTAQVKRDFDRVFEHFPRLKERRRQWARTLSGGEQQMLAIGRALMSNPKVLLLDEPTMGLSPVLVQEMARIIRGIHARGVPVVLVEQNAELALRLADYAYVLEIGSVALHGPAADLHENDHVRRAYLGA